MHCAGGDVNTKLENLTQMVVGFFSHRNCNYIQAIHLSRSGSGLDDFRMALVVHPHRDVLVFVS
jgi:hypothetical protein